MPEIEDQFKPIAYQYGAAEADEEKSRYELYVNWPSLMAFMPEPPKTVLDYGCGSGVYAKKLLEAGYEVLAVDNAPDMIAQAKNLVDDVKIWTYQDPPLGNSFDVIVAKLVVQFIEDLSAFAHTMKDHLKPGGRLIISVPNPEKSREMPRLADRNNVYATSIGTTGLQANMIHREPDEYRKTFAEVGLQLETTDQPIDSDNPDELSKRLNMVFIN